MRQKRSDIPSIIILCILILILAAGFCFCLQNLLASKEVEGYSQQVKEERYLDAFISDAENSQVETEVREEYLEAVIGDIENNEKETIDQTEVHYENSDLDYSDDNYPTWNGVKYTPDNAKGRIECVLEIPSIQLRRGVYTGTMYEIRFDQDLWMATVSSPDIILGKTRYIIYGHNAVSQELSFNRVQQVQVGDYFILTGTDAVYLYDVTDFLSMWRELFTWNYADNADIGSDKCYIATCGRGQYRYKDIVVEGTLRKKYTLSEWERAKNDIVSDRIETVTQVEDTRPRMELSAEVKSFSLIITLKDPKGNPRAGEDIVITDTDGLFLFENPETREAPVYKTDQDGKVSIPVEDFERNTEYVIGTYDFKDDEYRSPTDISFTLKFEAGKSSAATPETSTTIVTKPVQEEAPQANKYFYVWVGILGLSGILILISIILLIRIIVSAVKRNHAKS